MPIDYRSNYCKLWIKANIIMWINTMKTIQMTLEKSLLQEVDSTVKQLNTSRSAFMRDALREALRKYRIRQMEEQHRRGYERIPQDDMSDWIAEQVWEDDGEDWSQYYDAG